MAVRSWLKKLRSKNKIFDRDMCGRVLCIPQSVSGHIEGLAVALPTDIWNVRVGVRRAEIGLHDRDVIVFVFIQALYIDPDFADD